MADEHRHEAPIWDLATRLFHWALVLLIGTNLFLIEPRGGVATIVHLTVGYGVAGLLLFRLIWGFVGSPRSRFADFIRPWPVVKGYVDGLLRFRPPHSVGHNPLGGWMIVVTLGTILAMVVTGLFASGRAAAGPLAALIPVEMTAVAGEIHEFVSNILIALIVVHVAGVAFEWVLTRENLVKAMINGRKLLPADDGAHERPLVGWGRAALVAVLALAFAVALTAATNFDLNRASLRSGGTGNAVPDGINSPASEAGAD